MIIFKHKNVLVLAKLEQLHGCSFCPNSPSWSSRWQQFRKSLNKRFHTTTRRPPDTSTLCQIMFTRSSKSFIHKPELPWTGVWISVMHLLEQSRPALGTVSAKNVIKNKKRTESGIDIWSQPGQIVGAGIVSIWKHGIAGFRISIRNLLSRASAATVLDEPDQPGEARGRDLTNRKPYIGDSAQCQVAKCSGETKFRWSKRWVITLNICK